MAIGTMHAARERGPARPRGSFGRCGAR
jgi:hypothetical protein